MGFDIGCGALCGNAVQEALEHDRNVFLFSDNVEIAEEIALKRLALEKGRLVMGPDCGTAIVNGVGFGFANRVRQGNIGLVGASGTGLQAVTSLIHQLGGGVSHAIGTGGRDLKAEVGAATTLQAFDLLQRDSETESIVLVSKPPDRETIPLLERMLRASAKPVVLYLQGGTPFLHGLDQVYVAATLSQTAFLATKVIGHRDDGTPEALVNGSGFLRGLFAGGTLAQESAERLSPVLDGLQTNVSVGAEVLAATRGHSILDLGADEFTVGRLHPMIDPALRLDLIEQEASDPDVSLILLDVVLGDGSDPNPAAGIAAIIQDFRSRDRSKRSVEFVVMMVGTEEDPQNIERQTRALESAGARVFSDPSAALGFVEGVFRRPVHSDVPSVPLSALDASMSVVNIGLESFYESFVAQGANALQMDWSPPAEGDSRMQDILRKLTS